ncbi:MAG TPA: FimV/HubP family polar landmark protein [Ramlibacter sp.]|uniref:FimV/HubP family polar landmark protein n=1 Tax=Ramlibacter sp. TaxID=1917967 RepID=UPI002BD12FE7|nr:FimV/HubP family polar landmark protein [Ramlibacter sp.]HVZ46081.1 FimV/HubP family polar landmark protein [Ramlibacter sp.]
MALGRVSVQSALGEPLRVEIDIADINAEEVASLRARVAGPEAFRAAGLEFNPTLQNVNITLQRRPDGRYFLQLTSDRTITEPFVDLLLETSWSSGRIVRDYTMLFDPPNLRRPAAPLAAQITPAPSQAQTAPVARAPAVTPAAPVARAPSAPAAGPAVSRTPATRAATRPAPSPVARAAPAPAPAPTASADGRRVTVKEGDNATRIANANKPPSISLDQMLIALLRMNPAAFAGNNVNRLKAGAVLEIPSSGQAAQVGAKEAEQVLVAQTRDFNEFRRRLAEGLPVRDMRSGDRVVSGKVTTQIQEKGPAAASPDKLTLSKGAVASSRGPASADRIAQQRAAQEAASRVAELNKNITDLNKLGKSTGATAPAGAPPATGSASGARPAIATPMAAAPASMPKPAAPAVPLAAPAAVVKPASAPATPATPAAAPATSPSVPSMTAASAATAAPAVAASASAPAKPASGTAAAVSAAASSATSPASSASPAATTASAMPAAASASGAPAAAAAVAAAPAPAPKKPAAAPPPPPEPSFLDQLLDNPLIPAAAVGLLAMLLGLGFYKMRQRRKATQVDSSFLESRLQPDSFFGASGGQRIDTAEGSGAATGSSMVYSPSQLDAAGDVDPVAEADVYLAYGRDLQAEEILKEALRTNPSRVAIHAKLLEIYAKRRDAKAFELVATEAYNLTHGEGPEWEHICELGRELDAANPMYRPGGQPDEGAKAAAAAAAAAPAAFGATVVTQAMPAPATPPAVDLDLDLDFSLGDEPPAAAAAAAPAAASSGSEPTIVMHAATQPVQAAMQPPPALDLDFGAPELPASAPSPAHSPVAASEPPARLDAPDLTLDENALSFDLSAPPPAAPAPAPKAAPAPVAAAAAAPAGGDGMIEFDLGSLSLDLPGAKKEADAGPVSTSGAISTTGLEPESGDGDPLATKLALAEEFNAIGDPDGARSLAEEVLAEASGELKNRAQKLLAEIG